MELVVELKGYNRVRNDLRTLAAAQSTVLDPVLNDFAKTQRRRLKSRPYPPKLAGQRYRRTGRLANSFGVIRAGTAQYVIRNSARYASYVVGPLDKTGRAGGQAWMHRGRWWTMADVVSEDLPALRRNIEKELNRIWNDGT